MVTLSPFQPLQVCCEIASMGSCMAVGLCLCVTREVRTGDRNRKRQSVLWECSGFFYLARYTWAKGLLQGNLNRALVTKEISRGKDSGQRERERADEAGPFQWAQTSRPRLPRRGKTWSEKQLGLSHASMRVLNDWEGTECMNFTFTNVVWRWERIRKSTRSMWKPWAAAWERPGLSGQLAESSLDAGASLLSTNSAVTGKMKASHCGIAVLLRAQVCCLRFRLHHSALPPPPPITWHCQSSHFHSHALFQTTTPKKKEKKHPDIPPTAPRRCDWIPTYFENGAFLENLQVIRETVSSSQGHHAAKLPLT